MSAIFISHSSADNAVAGELKARLGEQGHRSVFLDFDPEDGIPAGRDWERELYARLRGCQAVIVLCSERSMASRWCFAEIAFARSLGKALLPIKIDGCAIPSAFSDVQKIDFRGDREQGYRRLWDGLRQAGLDPAEMFNWDGSRPPYPGLMVFQEQDAAVYFGRGAEIQATIEKLNRMQRLGDAQLAMVLGASGSGKSSLLRAGVIPRLKRDRDRWLVATPFNAVDDPFEQLAMNLSAALKNRNVNHSWRKLHKRLAQRATDKAATYVIELINDLRVASGQPEATLLLAIDQFEALLTSSDSDLEDRFLNLLRSLMERRNRSLIVIGTLRSDFLGNFQNHVALRGLPYEPIDLPQLSVDAFAEVIEGPARLAGLELEAGLTGAMVADAATDDALPLLAFALRELWEARGADGRLTIDRYRNGLGRLQGSVAKAADGLYSEAFASGASSYEQERDMRNAFLAMVRVDAGGAYVRKPARWSALPASAHALLERFVQDRLLVSRGEGTDRVLEVAHEALIRRWDKLRRWVEEDREFLRTRERIEGAVERWLEAGRDASLLLPRGRPLAEAQEILTNRRSDLGVAAIEFVEFSVKRMQDEEERWHRSYQVSLARQLAAQAQVILTSEAAEFSDRALLLAVEAMRRFTELAIPSLEADQALRQGLALLARRTGQARAKRSVDIWAVSANPRAPIVAYGQEDGQVWLWNLTTDETSAGPQLQAAIQQVAYSPNGEWLFIGDDAGECLLLGVTSGETRKLDQPGHALPTRAVAFSPDSRHVAVGFHNRVQVWDLATTNDPVVFEHPGAETPIVSMSFSGDGTVLVTQPVLREARCWKWESKELVGGLGQSGNQVLHSPDGRFLGVTGPGSYEALLWDVYKRETRRLADNGAKLAFSPDGRFVGMASPEHFAQTWSLPDLTVAHTMRHNAEVWDVDFSPDSSMLATVAKNNIAHVWSTRDGHEVARILHRDPLRTARFLANSRHVLTQSGDSTFTVWDTKELREVGRLEHRVAVLGIAFSADGRCLATHAREGWGQLAPVLINLSNYQAVEKLQLPDGQQVDGTQYAQELLEKHKQSSEGNVWSPDREFFAVAEGTVVKVYRDGDKVPEGEALQREPSCVLDHGHNVLRIVFSPDSRYLVTASDHDTARIWDVKSGAEVSRLTHANPNVVDVDFHPSGNFLATASWDHTARVWIWRPNDLMREASTRLTRNLSAEEWSKYLSPEPYRRTIPEIPDKDSAQESRKRGESERS